MSRMCFARTGLSDLAERWTTKLSGGQAQRVRFATALVANADLLVLDEPTAGIDVEGRHEFWEVMRGVAAEGKTVVFATHYLEEADAFADRIVLIARGSHCRRRAGHRDQGEGGVSNGPGDAAGGRPLVASRPARRDERRAPRRHGGAFVLGRRRWRSRHCSRRSPQVRDVEARGGSLEEAFLELTAEPVDPRPEEVAE